MYLEKLFPLIIILILSGVLPYKLTPRSFKLTGIAVIVSQLLVFVMTATGMSRLSKFRPLLALILKVVLLTSCSIGPIHGLTLILRTRKWISLLNDVESLEKSVPRNPFMPKYGTVIPASILIIQTFRNPWSSVNSLKAFLSKLEHDVTSSVVIVPSLSVGLLFSSILEMICHKLALITERASKNAFNPEAVKRCVLEHSELNVLAQRVSDMFGPQIVIYSINVVSRLVLYPLDMIELKGFSKINCMMIGYTLYLFSAMNFWCEQWSHEGNRFHRKLYFLARTNIDIRKNDTIRIYVATRNHFKMTACGFFQLGFPLLGSVVAGSITYLAATVQLVTE